MPENNSQSTEIKNDESVTTKSNVLKFIQKKTRLSKIEKIYDFRVIDWLEDPTSILNKIMSDFKSKYVIVRSSALGEDSMDESLAGTYLASHITLLIMKQVQPQMVLLKEK